MKWKKTSEYPLPDGDGKQWYIIEWENEEYDITQYPKGYGLQVSSRFCEFNPDEIESADSAAYKFENFSREDIKGEFKLNDFEPSTLTPEEQQNIVDRISANLDFKRLCDDKPKAATEVEIDSGHQQENTLQQGHAPIEFKGSCEPSWEEKFRWETARDDLIQSQIVSALRECSWTIDNEIKRSISLADALIEELKQGK